MCPHLLPAAGAVLGASLLIPGLSAQAPPFKATVETVGIYATVQDRAGHLVTGLTQEDFEVRDDGKMVALTVFSNEPQPIRVAVMLDTGDSVEPRLLAMRAGAEHFLNALTSEDRAAIGTFGDEITFSGPATSDYADLRRLLADELWTSGAPLLWNALEQAMEVLQVERGRRVILVVGDGEDMCAGGIPGLCRSFQGVRLRALADGVLIYAVKLQGTFRDGRANLSCVGYSGCAQGAPGFFRQESLPRSTDLPGLAAETGGGSFRLPANADLLATFSGVAAELRQQYVLGFVPGQADNREHRLDVRVRRAGLTVRARKTYIAKAAQ